MSWIQDGGHGGNDPGAVANGQQEKQWTLEASLYVNKRLNELGIKSDVTRSKDVTLSQSARTGKVKKYKKAISHHFNAGGGKGAELIHSIYADGKFEKILEAEFKKVGHDFRRTFTRKLNNGDDYYYMNRETGNCRVAIVEYDFLDGPNFDKINSKAYREKLYECVVKAICIDDGVKYVAPGKKEDKKEDNKDIYIVQTGDTLYKIAAQHNTTTKVLIKLNDITTPDLIHKGQKIKLPTASKPKQPSFKVNGKVKVKSSAKKYATGESIPSWVKGKSYTIQQVKTDRVLLKEIVSWVYKKDVE